MTNRQAIWSKVVRGYAWWLVTCAITFAALSLLPESFSRLVFIPLAMLVIAATFGYLMSKVRCLSCGYSFSAETMLSIRQGAGKRRINYCPHCGQQLDSEMSPNNSFKPNPLRGSA